MGITGDPDKVCELGALLKMTAELLVEQGREKDAALQLRSDKENCIKQLLQGQLDEAQAMTQLKKLQLSFTTAGGMRDHQTRAPDANDATKVGDHTCLRAGPKWSVLF